jgi:hypothetical protein
LTTTFPVIYPSLPIHHLKNPTLLCNPLKERKRKRKKLRTKDVKKQNKDVKTNRRRINQKKYNIQRTAEGFFLLATSKKWGRILRGKQNED